MTSNTGNLERFSVLVTGACGFLGRHLIEALVLGGANVVGYGRVRKPSDRLAQLAASRKLQLVYGDFSSEVQKLLVDWIGHEKGTSVVFHMAGLANAEKCKENPSAAFAINVDLTCRVLEFCRNSGIQKLVFPSTGLIYGDQLVRPARENDPPDPANIYIATKLAAESMIRGYAASFGMEAVIARLGNVYGPDGSPDTVAGTIIQQIYKQLPIRLNNLTAVRDFIYIQDVVEGLIRLMKADGHGRSLTVNLSTGIGSSIRQLAEAACRTSDCFPRIPAPESKKIEVPSQLVLDNSKLLETVGWKPSIGLDGGLSAIWAMKKALV